MTQSVDEALSRFEPVLPLAVALSGGADSTALLVACAQRWPGAVRAIHVHHGLQAAADEFERHCARLCERWEVPLTVQRVDARPASGDSPEEAARRARYAALSAAARLAWPGAPVRTLALAQHADDQVETVLLALSRGAGLPGLAAMPARWQRDGLDWARPLLQVARPDIEQWLQARQIEWLEDPTNADLHYTRNRIRHQLLPALAALTPAWRDTVARSAAHAAQAQVLLDEVAHEDLERVGVPPHIDALRRLSRPRQANVLRVWLRVTCGGAASAAQLDELMRQLESCTHRGHGLSLKVGTGRVRREGAVLVWSRVGSD